MRKPFLAGNWKMNLNGVQAKELAAGLVQRLGQVEYADVAVCPPFPYLPRVAAVLTGSRIALGAQNCHAENKGAFTGEVSPAMLVDVGCQWVILGHSERRHLLGETDEFIRKKMAGAQAAGLHVILCVGETLAEREADSTKRIIERQLAGGLTDQTAEKLARVVIAYEPVWAIGTGKNATPEQAEDVHGFIRGWIKDRFGEGAAESLRIQYGGSVNAANAASLLAQPNVDGALVGGASLKVDEFVAIVRAADRR
jgi:triosephosphate isomerase